MSEDEQTRRSYDLVADRYAAEIGDELRDKPLDRALLRAVCELVGDGMVADVGCGPGHVTEYLTGLGARVVGLDLSPQMCGIAGSRGPVACAADMTSLPVRSGSLAGAVYLYSVIHLGSAHRARAYRELARVLRSGGHALIAFHTSDADATSGTSKAMTTWWGREVALTFRFLDPIGETAMLRDAGLDLVARLDRTFIPGVEHASERSYLLVRRR